MDPEELHEALLQLRRVTDDELRARHNRSLPFGDTLFDRWERAGRLGFADGVSVYDSALIYGDVSVAHGTWIGPYTLLDGSGGMLTIGAYCSISAGVHIYTHDTVMWALTGGKQERRTAPVTIGDRCHVGSQSIVAAGVDIGDQSVVAANSFVNRSVPAGSIVAGSPARAIGRIHGAGDEVRLVYDADVTAGGTRPSAGGA